MVHRMLITDAWSVSRIQIMDVLSINSTMMYVCSIIRMFIMDE